MIFKKALRQELTITTSVVFMVLVTLIVTNLVIRLLGSAANGNINPKDVLVLIGLGMIGYLAILLTASLFIAILIVLTRWYKDSEMVIWQSAGVSLFQILRPVISFAIPIMVIVAGLAIFVSPWASDQSSIIKQRFSQRDDISMLAPGQFKESSSNNRVLFTESIDPKTNVIKNVFVTDFGKDRQLIVVANTGYVENTAEQKQLVLEAGRRYEGTPGTSDFRITEFDKYTVVLSSKTIEEGVKTSSMLPIWALVQTWEQKASQGEILWRLGLPLMALSFAVIAIPLSYMDPRRGRYTALIMAVLIYFTYSNLLKLMQAWVANGKLSFAIGVWLIHAIVAGLGIAFLIYRQNRSITLWGRIKRVFARETRDVA